MQEREDIVALDSSIILHPRVWEASGHVAGFSDPLVDCRTCKLRFRADHLDQSRVRQEAQQAARGDARVRPDRAAAVQPHVRDDDRPVEETGQTSTCAPRPRRASSSTSRTSHSSRAGSRRSASRTWRQVVPQRDHARATSSSGARVRADGDGVLRAAVRGDRWYRYWIEERVRWYRRYGLARVHLRVREHDAEELSHYSSATSDLEYLFPIGWSELEGVANRGDYDLTQHTEHSGTKLEWVEPGRRAVRPPRDRAGGQHRADVPRVPDRRLRRGGRGRTRADRTAPPPRARAGQGGGASADRQARGHGVEGARVLRGAAPRGAGGVRRQRRDRPPLPPPGRDRDAVRVHDRRPDARGRDGDGARPRLARAGAPADLGVRAWLADALRRPWRTPK